MKRFLFIYSLVITLGLTFYFAFSNPSKSTLIISFLMLPIPAYFLIALTNPKEVGVPKWSLRILIIIIILCFLSLFSLKFFNSETNKITPETKGSQVEVPISSPKPSKTQKPKGSDEFTDILIEESTNAAKPNNIIE